MNFSLNSGRARPRPPARAGVRSGAPRARVARRQAGLGLVLADRLGDAEALGQHVDQRRVDVVDRLAVAREHRVLVLGLGLLAIGGEASRDSALAKRAARASARHERRGRPLPVKEPSLAPILSLTATAMNAVNAIILDRMQSEIPLIPALAGHLIAGGGKRMRPMLTLAGAELVGYQGTRHHKLAAAVEFIHTATLLHDDVVDGSEPARQGRPPTSSSATRRRCWSATSCSAARSS
jgi:hypothetical protein